MKLEIFTEKSLFFHNFKFIINVQYFSHFIGLTTNYSSF